MTDNQRKNKAKISSTWAAFEAVFCSLRLDFLSLQYAYTGAPRPPAAGVIQLIPGGKEPL